MPYTRLANGQTAYLSDEQAAHDEHPAHLTEGAPMDPTVCLINALSAIVDHHHEDAADRFHDLAVWLNQGGFPPDVTAPGVQLQIDAAVLARGPR